MPAQKPPATLLLVPFREIRHDQPDDVLHYEPIDVRGRLHHWTIPAHQHTGLHQFQLLVRGSVQATIDGQPRVLQAPMALMVSPGVVHGFVYDRDSAGYQVTLPTDMVRGYFAHAPSLCERLDQLILVAAPELGATATECEALFKALAAEFQSSQPGRAEALHGHAILIALWFLRLSAGPLATQRRQALRDTLVQRYRALLETNFHRQESVSFYAGRLGVSADHLSRVCRATTGTGALDLMHERVVLEARRLLAYTNHSIVAIAQELGFADPGHFSRFFSKAVGRAPSSYRAAIAEGLAATPAKARAVA